MTDHATPNLPARDFTATESFYAALGFTTDYRADNWMILSRGGIALEFFPYPDLDPASSSFSACLRLDDMNALYEQCVAAGVPNARAGWPRIHPPARDRSGLTIAYLTDPDGTLLRLIQND